MASLVDIEIRRLGPDDLIAMRALNAMFGEVFEETDTYGDHPPDDAYLSRWLGRPQAIALAALDGERVVGGLVAYELEKFEQARSEVYIYDLGVDAAWRRRGIATALIERTQAIAAEIGAWVVFIQAERDDPPAVALYDKLGEREEVLHFDLPVTASSCCPD